MRAWQESTAGRGLGIGHLRVVDADDGYDDDLGDSCLLPGLVQVAGRRAEELRRLLLIGAVPRRGVDDDVDAGEGLGEAAASGAFLLEIDTWMRDYRVQLA